MPPFLGWTTDWSDGGNVHRLFTIVLAMAFAYGLAIIRRIRYLLVFCSTMALWFLMFHMPRFDTSVDRSSSLVQADEHVVHGSWYPIDVGFTVPLLFMLHANMNVVHNAGRYGARDLTMYILVAFMSTIVYTVIEVLQTYVTAIAFMNQLWQVIVSLTLFMRWQWRLRERGQSCCAPNRDDTSEVVMLSSAETEHGRTSGSRTQQAFSGLPIIMPRPKLIYAAFVFYLVALVLISFERSADVFSRPYPIVIVHDAMHVALVVCFLCMARYTKTQRKYAMAIQSSEAASHVATTDNKEDSVQLSDQTQL